MTYLVEDKKLKTQKTYSFDIFDTIFTRRTSIPVGIFKIIQYKLIKNNICPSYIADNFILLRTEAELYARKNQYENYKAEDVTLDEIYDVLKFNYNLDSEIVDKIKNLEIETEINNVVPLKNNIELFKKLKENSQNNVILVSDMYLPETVIRRMLLKADKCFDDVKLYLSCECGHKTKHYGTLYSYVKEKEDINTKNWLHYGDNPHADIFMAKESKINAKLIPQLEISSFGHYLLNCAPNDCKIDAIIGASRLAQKKSASLSYKLGTNITGPLLYSYVKWLLKDAVCKNFSDLYFVARDGYILKIIADEILKKKNYDLKTHYLYGSRQAWRLIDENNYKKVINYIFDEYVNLIDEKLISKRLGIETEIFKRYFDKNFTKEDLEENEAFKEFVIKVHKEKREILIKYIQQECGENPENIVLVDLDGSGRTQDCFQKAISDKMNSTVHCYYFQFLNATQKKKSYKYSYFLTTTYFNNWYEILTRNLEGQTLGYKYKEGKIFPILDNFSKELMLEWGYEDYIEGIKNYIENIIEYENINNIETDTYLFYMLLNNYKNTSSDSDLNEVLGRVIYEDFGNEDKQCAAPLNIKDCVFMLLGKKNIISGNLNLANIKIARSSKFCKKIFNFYCKYGSIRKFLINIYINKEIFLITFLGMRFRSKKIAKIINKLIRKNK